MRVGLEILPSVGLTSLLEAAVINYLDCTLFLLTGSDEVWQVLMFSCYIQQLRVAKTCYCPNWLTVRNK